MIEHSMISAGFSRIQPDSLALFTIDIRVAIAMMLSLCVAAKAAERVAAPKVSTAGTRTTHTRCIVVSCTS